MRVRVRVRAIACSGSCSPPLYLPYISLYISPSRLNRYESSTSSPEASASFRVRVRVRNRVRDRHRDRVRDRVRVRVRVGVRLRAERAR